MSDVLTTERVGAVVTITLSRPAARNALNTALGADLAEALRSADRDAECRVVILTGSDPAFCAGLDLRELGQRGLDASGPGGMTLACFEAMVAMTKPVVGAINGPAVTGGLELALDCDFLIASDRAAFADTHLLVGALPGGGLTVRLPQAVGLRFAKQMSFTGRFVDAEEALRVGLVNEVVPHDELLATAMHIATEIATVDSEIVATMRRNYDAAAATSFGEGLILERRAFGEWKVAGDAVEKRRQAIIQRGSAMTHEDPPSAR
jgi:enoyl-CoA hydratase